MGRLLLVFRERILSITRGVGNFIQELLAGDGKHAKAEVSRLFTRLEMMDKDFGRNRLTSKGEIATRAMFVAAETSFRKSRKPGTEKRRNKMMLDAFGDVTLRVVEGLLEEDIEQLKKDDIEISGVLNPEFIRTFEFGDYQRRCEEKAPLLWKVIRKLCGREDIDSNCRGGGRLCKSRDLSAVMAISSLLHARSEKANLMPKMLGLSMAALHVPKRAISLLGRLGVTISYSSINRILSKCAGDCLAEVVNRVACGNPFGVVYDNLVFTKRVSEETVLNRECLEKMTVNAIFFLRLGRDDNINAVRAGLNDDLPGLPRDLCLIPIPRGSSLLEVLGWGRCSKYWLKEAESQVRMVLKRRFGKEIRRTENQEREIYRKIPIHRTEFMVLPTLDIDPGTLPGNVDVVDGVLNVLKLKGSMLSNRLMPWNGDLFTAAMLNSVKVLRSRDKPENRLGFVDPWPGYLHAAFAYLSGIANLHMGDKKAWEPFSLRLFMDLLGRSKLTGPKLPYHGLHDFVELIRDSCIIADAILDLGESSAGVAFREKLANCNLEALIKRISKGLLDLNVVGDERARANDIGWTGIVSGDCPLPRSLSTEERKETKAKFIRDRSDPERDLVYENMRLFVVQASIYMAMYEHCRSGDSGGLEENLYLQTMFFHGAKKPKYAKEWLRQAVKRCCFWSADYQEVWYENCLVNLTGHPGHFMSVDEACEITVDAIKNDFNPRGSWQSREFHMETVAPNINMMREIRRQVMNSSGASAYGSRHSSSAENTEKDMELVTHVLLENNVMSRIGGRVDASVGGEKRRFREVVDAIMVGQEVMRNKAIPKALINIEKILAEEEEDDLDDEAELEYYDESMEGGFMDLDRVHIDLV